MDSVGPARLISGGRTEGLREPHKKKINKKQKNNTNRTRIRGPKGLFKTDDNDNEWKGGGKRKNNDEINKYHYRRGVWK